MYQQQQKNTYFPSAVNFSAKYTAFPQLKRINKM